ncbi:Hypothetical predicted protein [Mytilus galloprovincialis]|uniref:Uncharacterized protein n=1 Tax=Mytilus galloprovincialis TaxID=29158 RepID=A0A8B6EZW8_MYTGA|nr:Hypothetical predicted protein [Mytilus galloprovincialis]
MNYTPTPYLGLRAYTNAIFGPQRGRHSLTAKAAAAKAKAAATAAAGGFPRTPEASRLRTEVLHIGQGETPDGDMEDDRLSEDDSLVSSDEDMTKEAGDAERQEDLIACQDYGVVFAHISGLEPHSHQGCGEKTALLSR